jgi:hypothetical protein
MSKATPLFPLRTVLFPDGPLPLRIFEPRYIDMVRECTREQRPFGVVLVVGQSPEELIGQIGTYGHIVDFDQLEDGLLGIQVRAAERFQVQAITVDTNGLIRGDLLDVACEPGVSLPPAYAGLSHLLQQLMESVGHHYPGLSDATLQEARWVGYRLAELFPIDLEQRQQLLELDDPITRLERLMHWLPHLAERQ